MEVICIFTRKQNIFRMKTLHVRIFDTMKALEKWASDNNIGKEDIISIFQDSSQNYVLSYFAE